MLMEPLLDWRERREFKRWIEERRQGLAQAGAYRRAGDEQEALALFRREMTELDFHMVASLSDEEILGSFATIGEVARESGITMAVFGAAWEAQKQLENDA